ncbi:hypothetical protein GCM10011297_32670 [Bacterioplanes sanyensis]|uniref:DUF1826 domain-containing protein n=1 Tax=Bacterioplanes sanyensis TaxID=1249553 RepID=UPI0019CC8FAB|nr:DUF1826 domain-containing protein [Bacterioplanes sanyensis]GGY57495.1 hypothetical protein GCM10011297_32670 [Bacterioplanes sanyensis]
MANLAYFQRPLRCTSSSALLGDNANVLTHIYDAGINLVAWRRSLADEVADYAQFLASADCTWSSLQCRLEPEAAFQALARALPDAAGKAALVSDAAELVDMFCCLFDLPAAGLRLALVNGAMCPKFHVDKVPCRLVTSYLGPGSEWLYNHQVERSRMGHRTGGKADRDAGVYHDDAAVQQLAQHDVVLLKGENWLGNEGNGAVHRSPTPVPPAASSSRLLLTLDFAD